MLLSTQKNRNFFTPILGILNLRRESDDDRPQTHGQKTLSDGRTSGTRCDTITGLITPENTP